MTLSSYTQLTATLLHTLLSVVTSVLPAGHVWVIVDENNRESYEDECYHLYGPYEFKDFDPELLEEEEKSGDGTIRDKWGRNIDAVEIYKENKKRKSAAKLFLALDVLRNEDCDRWWGDADGMLGKKQHPINAWARMGFKCCNPELEKAVAATLKKDRKAVLGHPNDGIGFRLWADWDYVNQKWKPGCLKRMMTCCSTCGSEDYDHIIPTNPGEGDWYRVLMTLRREKRVEIRANYTLKEIEGDAYGKHGYEDLKRKDYELSIVCCNDDSENPERVIFYKQLAAHLRPDEAETDEPKKPLRPVGAIHVSPVFSDEAIRPVRPGGAEGPLYSGEAISHLPSGGTDETTTLSESSDSESTEVLFEDSATVTLDWTSL